MAKKPEVILEEENEEAAGETGSPLDLKRLAILAVATAAVGIWIILRRKNGPQKEATVLPFPGKPAETGGKPPEEGPISNSGWESVPLKPI